MGVASEAEGSTMRETVGYDYYDRKATTCYICGGDVTWPHLKDVHNLIPPKKDYTKEDYKWKVKQRVIR